MIINVRTRYNTLQHLLALRCSGNWRVSAITEASITKVRVFDWDTTQVLKGDYNPLPYAIKWDPNGDLILGIRYGRIENFHFNDRWFDLFGAASVVYTEEVSIQIIGNNKIGIVRETYTGPMTPNEINDYFERLIREIKLRGLNKIVFRAGGIPLPDSFINWCKQNGVEIEILDEEEYNEKYPTEKDIIWEDELIPEDRKQQHIE
jgi:hypothetical protein